MSGLPAGVLRTPATTPGAAPGPDLGLPTRSDIEGWIDAINDLSSSAAEYRAAAELVESSADAHVQQMSAPDGTVWEGDAADVARESGYADRGVVYRVADHLRDLAKVANAGAQNLGQARGSALDAIADAEGDDFRVDDDLAVTDTRRYTSREISRYMARKAQAQEHHRYIAMRAGTLASGDAEIGARLQAGAATLNGMIPLHWNKTDEEPSITVQAVDHRSEPGVPDQPAGGEGGPGADDIRRVLENLPEGSRPWIREVRSPQDLQLLWTWMGQNGVENPNRYGDPSKGVWKDLPDGSGVGQRFASRSTQGPSLDISLKGGEHWKVHINTETGGVPGVLVEGSVEVGSAPADRGWGTHVSPEDARQSGGALEILQKFVDAARPPDSPDPRNMA